MKKAFAILLALVLMLGCFSIASADAKTYKVGVSIYQFKRAMHRCLSFDAYHFRPAATR